VGKGYGPALGWDGTVVTRQRGWIKISVVLVVVLLVVVVVVVVVVAAVAPGQIILAKNIQKRCIRPFCAFRRKNSGIYDVVATSRTKLIQNTTIHSVF